MNKISVMTLGFLKDTIKPYMSDRDGAKLKERFIKLFVDIKNAGFEYIDLAAFELRMIGENFISEQLKTMGLSIASFIQTGRYADTSVSVEDHLSDAKDSIETAIRLGADCLLLVPTTHPDIIKLSENEIFINIVTNIKPIVEYATKKGLMVVVEDYPDPSLHLSSRKELDRLLEAIPELRLAYDSANMLIVGDDPVQYAEYFKDRISHVHIKDLEINSNHVTSGDRTLDGREVRTVFIGTGEVDIPNVIKTLNGNGYTGCLTVEFGEMMYKIRANALKEAKKYIVECIENA